VRDTMRGFKEFLSRGNVVDLAVAVVVGTAFTAVVHSLVSDLLTPFIAAIIGKPNFSDLTFTINHSKFTYGSFINSLITFLSVAVAVYFFVVVPITRLNERRRRGQLEPPDEVAPTDEALLLGEIRDILTSSLAAGRTATGSPTARTMGDDPPARSRVPGLEGPS